MGTYQNPIQKHGDFADPFVLRYNGIYYLYCTNPGVLCWTSADLIHWTPQGPVVPEEEFPGLVPFAPEVVCNNGSFYMYTSPHGLGHYVLKSNSPLGPFHKITENIGHSIDFSVFVDEDEKWYAYWADDKGILGCEMTSPTQFGPPHYIGAFLHGWTEGPFVVKQDGKYHLTYTGNHFLSKGYRVQGAVSDAPLGPYTDYPHNPLLIRTQGQVVGLGHSSTVLGPDLQSFYIFYHNLNPDCTRDLNLDAVTFFKDESYVLGPSVMPLPCPALPDYSGFCTAEDDEKWTCRIGSWHRKGDIRLSSGALLAHCTETLPEQGAAEFYFGSASVQTDCCGILLQTAKAQLQLFICRSSHAFCLRQNEKIVWRTALPQNFCFEALHCLRLCFSQTTQLWLDALKLELPLLPPGGAQFGYFSDGDAQFGSTCVASQKRPDLCPIPCTVKAQPRLRVQAPETGTYLLNFLGEQPHLPEIWVDEAPAQSTVLRHTAALTSLSLILKQGLHELRFEKCALTRLEILPLPSKSHGTLQATLGPYDKVCAPEICTDCSLTALLQPVQQAPGWQAGVLLRASQLADGGEGDDKQLGTNFFIGYRVGICDGAVQLWRHRYDETLLAQTPVEKSSQYRLDISAAGNVLEVAVNGKPCFRFSDPNPLLQGQVGFHVRNCLLVNSEINFESQ